MKTTIDEKLGEKAQDIRSIQVTLDRILNTIGVQGGANTVEAFSINSRQSSDTYVADSMIPTMSALARLGKDKVPATASTVARITKRSRNIESAYLTRLASQNHCVRSRVGRRVIYSLA